MEYNTLIIGIDELWLKGKNRPLYFKAFKNHVHKLLHCYHKEKFVSMNEFQRLVVTSEHAFTSEFMEALKKLPGISNIAPAIRCESEIEAIRACVLSAMSDYSDRKSKFRVNTRRVDKHFPVISMEVSRQIGGMLLAEFPDLSVDLHNPEMVVDIKILAENTYISFESYTGIGGLPMGMNGHLITLLSGGFDSPVASYLMSKRGCKQTFAFFYAYPFVGDEVKDKITELCSVLAKYQADCELYVIPFGNFQKLIAKDCREEYRTVFFRRYMIEAATILAKKVKGQALLTGDCLGQVSSQTIGNITAVDRNLKIPIFRPLIGFNKQEIIALSKIVRTHDISVRPHDDACSLLAPKKPIIKPDWVYWDRFGKAYDYTEQLLNCIEEAEIYKFSVDGKFIKHVAPNESL